MPEQVPATTGGTTMGEEHDRKNARGDDAQEGGEKDRYFRNAEAEADGAEVEGHRVMSPTERFNAYKKERMF
jgi:hypothetical protein